MRRVITSLCLSGSLWSLIGCCCYDPCLRHYDCVVDQGYPSGYGYGVQPYGVQPYGMPAPGYSYPPTPTYETPPPNPYLIPPASSLTPAAPETPPAPPPQTMTYRPQNRNAPQVPLIPEHSLEAGLPTTAPDPGDIVVPPPPAEPISEMSYRRRY